MDFLNQAITQVRDLLLSMTPAARVTAVLLSGVIVVSLGYLVQQQSAGPDDFLFNGEFLPPRDADRAEAAIAQAGLTGYERIGNRIRVPRGSKAEYLAAVADAGALPPNFHTLLENALDLSPFTDRETRRQRLKAAREQQLSMMIRAMDSIEEAQVIYDIREPRGLSKEAEATATVTIRTTPGESIDPRRAKRIKEAVASAIAGLGPEGVTVTNLSGGGVYGADGEVSAESFDDPYFQKKVAYERLMKANIEDLLRDVPGARVQVTAELDIVVERTTKLIEPNGEAVAQRETTLLDESETTEIDQGGRPGLTSQGPTRNADQEPQVTVKNRNTVNNSDADNFIPTKEEFFTETGMTPENVRVAIAVPSDYLVSVWREQERKKGNDVDQPLPANIQAILDPIKVEVIKNIENAVVQLLPKKLAENAFSDVAITFFESLTPEPIAPPSTASQAMAWASQNFGTMTMALIAMVSLVMLRSMVKAIPPSEPDAGINAAALAFNTTGAEGSAAGGGEGGTSADEKETGRTKLRLTKGPNLKEDLTEIVREDPDAAAAILRTWIGNAG
ncbi:MAG: hypothetical protein KDA57_07125 [Planctomycetales bacterium]|nr:hypothetical protein [Planctomycetales bacterium]